MYPFLKFTEKCLLDTAFITFVLHILTYLEYRLKHDFEKYFV